MDKNYIKFKALYYWDDNDKCYYGQVPGFEEIFTDGVNVDEIENNLIEIMALTIQSYIDDDIDYFEKLKQNNNFNNEENKEIIYISFFLPYEISKTKDIYEKKTLTVPVWLNILAKQKNINFSRVLQEGLKKELNIK